MVLIFEGYSTKFIPPLNPLYTSVHINHKQNTNTDASPKHRFARENSAIMSSHESAFNSRESALDIDELSRKNSTNLHSSSRLSSANSPNGQSLQNHLDILNSLESSFSPFNRGHLDTHEKTRARYSSDLLDSLEVIERQLASVMSYKPISMDHLHRRTRSPRVPCFLSIRLLKYF